MRPDLSFKPGAPAEHVGTREGYDRWAEIYDAEDNPLIALETPRVRALLGDVRGRRVADLGCGTGRYALPLVEAGADVVAVDFSDGMLRRAERKSPHVAAAAERPSGVAQANSPSARPSGVAQANSPSARPSGVAQASRLSFVRHDLNLAPLPLAGGAFDVVLACLVLEHIRDMTAFLTEARRIARPGAPIIVTALHPAMMLRGIHAHFRDPQTGTDVCPAAHPWELSDYVMAAIRAGLRIADLSEHAVDEALAARSPRAAKYRGWPMLLIMQLRA